MGFLIKAIVIFAIAAKYPNCQVTADYVSSAPNLHCVKMDYTGQGNSKKKPAGTSDPETGNSGGDETTKQTTTAADGKKIFVHSKTMFLKAETLEAAFRKNNQFLQSGFVFTTSQYEADVIIEIVRAPFTTEFPYSIINPKTHLVIGSGKVNSVGGTVAGKITSGFMKQIPAINAAIQK